MFDKLPRLLFSLPFIVLGSMHFVNGPAMVGLVPSYVPGGIFWVYVTGACLVAAGISLNIGKRCLGHEVIGCVIGHVCFNGIFAHGFRWQSNGHEFAFKGLGLGWCCVVFCKARKRPKLNYS